MEREIQITGDGSATIAIPEMQVTYHSRHGAIQESMHVFIEAGLKPLLHHYETLHIFEMGFGTGLNALLTVLCAQEKQQKISYEAVEAYPLEPALAEKLNYHEQLQQSQVKATLNTLHTAPWGQPIPLSPWFTLHKHNSTLANLSIGQRFHLIYYDAFAPSAQPELWTVEIFTQLFNLLREGGVLVTYCSKGNVRRAMQTAGFLVEKIPGPPGKREMVRARKP